REQLLARGREATEQFCRTVDVDAHEPGLRRSLQDHELDVAVRLDGTSQESDLPPRFTLEVQDLLTAIAHVDQRFLLVVLEYALAGLRRHTEPEPTCPRIGRRELDP